MWALRLWGLKGGSARKENPTFQEQSLKKRKYEQCMALQKADILFSAVTVSASGSGVTDFLFMLPKLWPLACVSLFAVLKAHQGYKD